MRKIFSPVTQICIFALIVLSLSACLSSTPGTTSNVTSVGTPRDQTLVFQDFDGKANNPDEMNPLMNYAIWRGFRELGWGALWEMNTATGKSYGELASDLPVVLNQKHTDFQINLRHGIYWSDGVEFTADDVIYTLDTYFKVMLRLVEPTGGRAIIHDRVVAGAGKKPAKREFLSTVQPIFQNPFEAFSRYRTVDSYLYETATQVKQLKKAEALDAMAEALASVGLEYKDVRQKYPNQFSGGELQRISVARALIPHPELIVADEPVSMIDASRRMIIINLFLSLKQEYKTSILYITHDLATAYYISDYIAVMKHGSIVEFGQARQVLSDPQHAYTRLLLDSIPTVKQKWVR